MRFGIAFANIGPLADPAPAAEFARHAEAAGFESVWTVEHVIVPEGYRSQYPYDPSGKMPGGPDSPIPDPLIWLAWVAAATDRLRLATGILILPQRNPVVLAKELATLDHLSGGRVELGVGVGWLQEEFAALGVPFDSRGRRTDEYVVALRTLWSDDAATVHGEFVHFDDCVLRPQPTAGRIPVHVGGHTEVAARRAGRLGDGFFPGRGDHTELAHLFDVVRASAEEAGRDPADVELSAGGNGAIGRGALEEVAALASMGVDRVMIPSYLFWRDPEASLARYGEEVIARS